PPPQPPSFPTRRSSDLDLRRLEPLKRQLQLHFMRRTSLTAVSRHAARELGRIYGVAPASVTVVHNGTRLPNRCGRVRPSDDPRLDRKSTRLNSSHLGIS